MADKPALRKEVLSRVARLSAEQRERATAKISRRLWTVPGIERVRTLLLYASLPGEVGTDEIGREAVRRGIEVVYPRCLPATREMALHRVERAEELVSGTYGIREPDPACTRVEVETIDWALVPGLAWDRRGGRLGRGAGYYDRLFARPAWRARRCGLSWSIQELPEVPTEPWDVPLDIVVTEREIVSSLEGG